MMTNNLFRMVNMAHHYQAPTVSKAFSILESVCRTERGMSLSQLSRQLDISKSTVHGIAAALVETGALVRDSDTLRYRPGPTLLRLGRAASARMDVASLARRHMETLRDRIEESVFLGVRSGQDVTIIEMVASTRDLKITAPVGTRLPLLAGATGKAFLAQMDDDQVRDLLTGGPLPRFTPSSIQDAGEYARELGRVRRRGYATDDEEYLAGVRAVACTVDLPQGPPSAIWVVGFSASLDDEKLPVVCGDVVRTAGEIVAEATLRIPA